MGDPRRLAIVDALYRTDLTVGALARIARMPTNQLAFHLDVLEDAGVIRRRDSDGDARRRYVALRADAARLVGSPARAPIAERSPTAAPAVLFVCTANSARSQLAAGLWAAATGRAALSAGTEPAPRIHPLALLVAHAHGLDLDAAPRHLRDVDEEFELVVSVCDRAHEAGLPIDVPRLHWSIQDPAAGDASSFESVFTELSDRVARLKAAA